MVADKVFDDAIPGYGELDALKVIQAIAKLAATHDTYINQYPELSVLVEAIVGEVTIEEPEADDLLLLRLINILQCLNKQAADSDVFKIIRNNFQANIYHEINGNLPVYEGQFYL
ncbi:hypothetical protein ACFS7Z_13875 [Pontibacter toksunensis]|uniref:Uncharacterized protein n=1 Tax=Pontibacter toksunensis TaxID=1332631 RepID=A0ABW6BV91_9BACT